MDVGMIINGGLQICRADQSEEMGDTKCGLFITKMFQDKHEENCAVAKSIETSFLLAEEM
jgi:hypothetical protein